MIDEKLSYELLCCIFKELTLQDRVRCTGVSRRWRDILIRQWPGMWRHIEYTEEIDIPNAHRGRPEYKGFFAWLFSQAPADNVRSLVCKASPAFHAALVPILYRKPFPRLKTLRLINTMRGFVLPSLEPHKVLTDELECLEIGFSQISPGPTTGLVDVLLQRPSLTEPTLRGLGDRRPMPGCQSYLTCLHWFSDAPIPLSMIKQCPNLCSLVVLNRGLQGNANKLVTNIARWCPQLKFLSVQSDYYLVSENGHQMSVARHHDKDARPGLQKLVLQTVEDERVSDAAELILRNRQTLLHLDIEPNKVDLRRLMDTPDILAVETLVIGPDICWQMPPEPFVKPLVGRMPNLQHLHLVNFDLEQNMLLDLLTVCPRLRSLHLESLSGELALVQEQSVALPYLEELEVDDCHLDDAFLDSLDMLDALKEVNLTMRNEFTEKGRDLLLAKAPNIKTMKFFS
ncbi:hypothetical protein BCR43DRAFT_510915 [Syncephalastrum racemosum]|uniref:F-box domain-containing protein n=1 Tax=Syncephalastrum racemosum TaxID=13706 RepID=A0A1X2HWE3_SYNRA|nr:hypothetical protein BCR43DRAFT_510915 [Syncephalastrum racemosum]